MMKITYHLIFLFFVPLLSCSSPQESLSLRSAKVDEPFLQDYSIKYYFDEQVKPKKVFEDRNGTIQVLTDKGLYRPHAGEFLYPGEMVADRTYLPMADKNLSGMGMYQSQFLYLDDKAVFGNAWAVSLYMQHQFASAKLVASGDHFDFLVSDGTSLVYLVDSKNLWSGNLDQEKILDIKNAGAKLFLILTENGLHQF